MSPAIIFTKQGVEIMAIKNETNQISFDDLDFEAEYEEDRQFFTISGKEYMDVHDWEKYGMYDLDVGDDVSGIPEITYFENKDRKSDSLRFRVADDGEYVDLYINIPKPDKLGYINNIRKGFDFYRTCFDFIYSILKFRDERNVVNSDGEEINVFRKVNIINFAKYVDQMKRVNVKITEGNSESDYNSFIIWNME
jgi:hypothetical protein